jgi:NADPH-dependent curcumin reductase CurA
MTRTSVILKSRPHGAPKPSDFALVEQNMPMPAAGEVLTRVIFLSLDPYMRGRISGRASYAAPIELGGDMMGETVGEVLASHDPAFAPGDIVVGAYGWASHVVTPGARLTKITPPAGVPLSAYLGVLGMPGVTAYSGMTDIGEVKQGETVVISAASGAVGSVAGQLAKRAGAKVIGVAGGAEKCLFVQETLGFDGCIDHRAGNLETELDLLCPDGIDVYFENVGGALQRAVWPRLKVFGRVIMCGMVAQYNATEPQLGPDLMQVVGKRLRVQGLIVSDKPARFAEWRGLAAPWVAEGSLKYREDVVNGLDSAVTAFIGLLEGRNFGKLVVRVGPDTI